MSEDSAGLVRRLGRRLPASPATAVRRSALGWGIATARWRAKPDLIVVGAQRCGTTTLFRLLSGHPGVQRPTLSKGIGYFEDEYHRGPAWYAGHFPLRRSGQLTFESSGYYLFHPLAAERIARDLPGVRVVAMVRDPVDRAHSAHAHELRRGFETESFEDAVALEESRLAGEVERLRTDPDHRSFSHRHHAYLARGRYAELLEPYVSLLGPERVLTLDPWGVEGFRGEWQRLQEWLGLSEWSPADIAAWNPAPRAPMDTALRARLERHFEASDRSLAALLGRTPSWRA